MSSLPGLGPLSRGQSASCSPSQGPPSRCQSAPCLPGPGPLSRGQSAPCLPGLRPPSMGQLASCLPNSGPLSGGQSVPCPPYLGPTSGGHSAPACLAQGLYPGVSQHPAHSPLGLEEKSLLGCNLVGPPPCVRPGDTRDKMLGSWGGGGTGKLPIQLPSCSKGQAMPATLLSQAPACLWPWPCGRSSCRRLGGALASVQPS